MDLCIPHSLITKKGKFHSRDIIMRLILWWHYGYNNSFRNDIPRHSIGLDGNISGRMRCYILNNGKYKFTIFGDKFIYIMVQL